MRDAITMGSKKNYEGAPSYVTMTEVTMMRVVLHETDSQRWSESVLDAYTYAELCQAYYTRPNPKFGKVTEAP